MLWKVLSNRKYILIDIVQLKRQLVLYCLLALDGHRTSPLNALYIGSQASYTVMQCRVYTLLRSPLLSTNWLK